MCKCTPEVRTPFCGKLGCEWPGSKPDGARASQEAVSDERLEELREMFARPADAGLAWNNMTRRRDDVASICAELQRSRLLLAQLRNELQATQCAEAMALDDVKALRLLLAAVRELLPALHDLIGNSHIYDSDSAGELLCVDDDDFEAVRAALRKIVSEMGE
jgi:hypothetical protein